MPQEATPRLGEPDLDLVLQRRPNVRTSTCRGGHDPHGRARTQGVGAELAHAALAVYFDESTGKQPTGTTGQTPHRRSWAGVHQRRPRSCCGPTAPTSTSSHPLSAS